jgi:hypothetical protein
MSEDLAVLNAARRWWLACKPYAGLDRPTDAEMLAEYAKRGQTAVTGCEHHYGDRQIPCPPMCPVQQWPRSMFRLTWSGRWKLRRRYR